MCSSDLDELGQLHFFCINDTTDDAHTDDPRLATVRHTLAKLFPEPSSFERAGPAVAAVRLPAAAPQHAEPACA